MIQGWVLSLKLIFIPIAENNYRPKFLESRVLIWCLLALFILKLITVPFLIYFPKSALFGDISKIVLIELLNKDRQEAGLQPLKENTTLDKAAFLKAQDMLNKDYFGHQSPEGLSPWHWLKIAGYKYQSAGENLAIGFLDSQEVYQAWLNSPSHRANLLSSSYQEVGTAVLTGDFQGNKTTVVVQFFGKPEKIVSSPKVQTKNIQASKESREEIEKEVKEAEEEKEVAKEEIKKEEPSLVGFASPTKEVISSLNEIKDKATFNFLYFFYSDYYKILQIIIYGFLALIILSLLINIFVRFDIQHRDLILKALGFIVILVIFILVDKGAILKLIPHQFSIY
jgi:hypothetical protein